MTDNSITVIGSGATALAAAAYLTIKGKQVILCDREQGQRFRDIEDGGRNYPGGGHGNRLPGASLPYDG